MTESELLEAIGKRNIKLVGEYKSPCAKTRFKCLLDGHEWDAYPKTVFNGSGCARCAGTIKRTQSEFIEQVAVANPNVEVIKQLENP